MKKATFYHNDPTAPKPNRPNLIGATVLIEYNKRLLLEHRADSERWAIVGGSLRANESLVDCAIRETREESRELRFFSKAELKNIKIVETHIPILQELELYKL